MQTHEPPALPTSRALAEAPGLSEAGGLTPSTRNEAESLTRAEALTPSDPTGPLRAELAECRRRLALLTNLSSTIVYIFDVERRAAEWVSRDVRGELGYSPEELAAMGDNVVPQILHVDDLPIVEARLARWTQGDRVPDDLIVETEYRLRHRDGTWRWFLAREAAHERHPDGRLKSLVGMAFDIHARKELAAQELRAEKLESLGRLAGGIAHDFNNILTVVLGNVALARSALAQGADPVPQLDEIHRVADQAAAISRQLLGFARRQATRVEVIDLNQCLEELAPMLRRLLDPRGLTLALGRTPTVRMDRAQLAQAFLNLVTNAREADGSLIIKTEQVDLDRGLGPRPYARIVFTDDGRGMAADTVQRAFDPFFTTKGRGGGAGLGLATVHGIVHQHGGTIDVTSEPGRGTRVTLTLPGLELNDAQTPRPTAPNALGKGGPRGALILVAEDEPMVAELTRRILTHAGHRVLLAPDGKAALEVFETSAEPIELVVSDIVMPQMSGLELARRLTTLRPKLPILLASGYPEDDRRLGDDLLSRTPFLAKPFKSSDLVAAVASLLTAAREAQPESS